MDNLILTDSERRLLADVTAIHARKTREAPQVAEYIDTVYGRMPAETWGSYLAMTNLPE